MARLGCYHVDMTTTMHDINEPLTYANAPTYSEGDVTYVDEDALMELAEREMPGWKPLFDRLATQ